MRSSLWFKLNSHVYRTHVIWTVIIPLRSFRGKGKVIVCSNYKCTTDTSVWSFMRPPSAEWKRSSTSKRDHSPTLPELTSGILKRATSPMKMTETSFRSITMSHSEKDQQSRYDFLLSKIPSTYGLSDQLAQGDPTYSPRLLIFDRKGSSQEGVAC